jgi:hypothetical protein
VPRDAAQDFLLDRCPTRHGITDSAARRVIERGVSAAFGAAGERTELSRGVYV